MPDTLSVVAGAIPVVGSVISSLIQNSATQANNAADRDFQSQMFDKQTAVAQANWAQQNAYNSPAAQMQRYKDAGLNPNLIYGSATGNVAQPISVASRPDFHPTANRAPDLGAAAANGIMAYNNTKLGVAQTNNVEAQTTVAIQDAFLKGTQAAEAVANTAKINADTTRTTTLTPYDAAMSKANTDKLMADTKYSLDNNERQAAMNAVSLREAVQRIANMRLANTLIPYQRQEMQARVDNLMSSTKLQNMDLNLRNQGVMPHDNLLMRVAGNLLHSAGINTSGTATSDNHMRSQQAIDEDMH